MSDERERDSVGDAETIRPRTTGGSADFEGHGKRVGDKVIDADAEAGDESDFEGHSLIGGDKFIEKVSADKVSAE